MVQILHTMYSVFSHSKTQGSYFLLFAISIFVLYCVDKKRNKWFMLYPVMLIVLFVANPITIWAISFVVPSIATYEPILAVLPIIVSIPFACTEILSVIKSAKQRHLVGVVLFLFIALCGNLFGLFKGDTMSEAYHYDSEKKEIVSYIDLKNPQMVISADVLAPYIGNYTNNTRLLYGMDLWVPNMDTGIQDAYSEEVYLIHELMKDPSANIADIIAMGLKYDCDIIVTERFDGAKAFEGPYIVGKMTDNYIIYMRH